jgi:peptidoglycan/LPS O-acetylase OafA/YrhL
LRFFAAIEVVIYHALPLTSDNFWSMLFSAGPQAVTFFFVLSGFILAYVYSGQTATGTKPISALSFWRARLARILPAYILALFLALPDFAHDALVSNTISLGYFQVGLVMVPLLMQSFYPTVATAWNAPAWSLSVEMAFYFVFPVLLQLTKRIQPTVLLVLSYSLIVALQPLHELFRPDYSPEDDPAWNFYWFSPIFHLSTFFFGFALGRFYLFGRQFSSRTSTVLIFIGFVTILIITGCRTVLPIGVSSNPVLVFLFGMLILGGARPGRILIPMSGRTMVLLGEASYAIYILHMPILIEWQRLTRENLRLNIPVLLDASIFLMIVLAVAVFTFVYVEQPLRAKIRRSIKTNNLLQVKNSV